MKDYSVVTVSNRVPSEWYYLTKEFEKSLAGEQIHNICYNKDDYWRGLNTKPKWLYRAINEGFVNSRYIIFCDSWDLVFAEKPANIIDAFKAVGKPLIISAEKNCFPDGLKSEFDKLENYGSIYKYVNSGFIVGETEALLTCLESMDLPNLHDDYFDSENNCAVHGNDQYEWMKVFIKQPVPIELDYEQYFSQTLHDANVSDFVFTDHEIINKHTNSIPMTFHFNGAAKTGPCREPILKHLRLINGD